MSVMQIHHRRRNGVAERRSLLKPGRSLGGHAFAATRTTAAEQSDLGHIRADEGQLDTLIDLLRGLRRVGEYRLALGAGVHQSVDRAIPVSMQPPANTGAAFS